MGQAKRERGKETGGRRKQNRSGRQITGGTDSGLHHPAIEDGKNSYSLREFRSLEDSSGWPEEWQC